MSRSRRGSAFLLERDDELKRLSALADAGRRGNGALAIVEGPPGIGKSALFAAVSGLTTEAGFELLTARGGEQEQDYAFGIVRQLFEAFLGASPESERAELLAGAASLARPVVDPAQMSVPAPLTADPFPLLHGLYWLVANLAERAPLGILIDDAHWADIPSLRWLQYLSRRLDGVAALVMLTVRSTAPEAPIELIETIKAESSCALMHPLPLSAPASGMLLADVLGSDLAPDFLREAHRVTRGNPFLLNELGRSLAAEAVVPESAATELLRDVTPKTILRSVLSRLARLQSDARELAQAAALLGEEAELRHAAVLAGLGEYQALDAADSLVAAGLLELGPRFRFTHPLLRQAVYADMPAGERARRHKDAARLLIAESVSNEGAAVHLLATTPAADPWVVDVLCDAATAATASGAPEIAVSYLRRALAEPPGEGVRADVLLSIGQGQAQAADPGAFVHLEAAARAARDPLQRSAALGILTFLRYGSGETASAAAAAREALAEIRNGCGGESEAQLLVSYFLAGRAVPELVNEVRAALDSPRTGPGDETTPAEVARLALASMDACLLGQLGLAAQRLRSAVEQGTPRGGADRLPVPMLGAFYALLGQHREAGAELECALSRARRRGSQLDTVLALEARAHLRWRSGNLTGAIADAETELGMCEELAQGAWDPVTLHTRVTLAISLIERGDLGAAEVVLELPETLETRLPDTWGWLWLPYGRARLAFAHGKWGQAQIQALAAGERLLAIQAPSPDYLPWRSLAARASALLGEHERSLSLAREELMLARQSGSARAIGVALATLGTIEQGERGLNELSEAVQFLADSPDRLEHARALCELGSALRRANHRTDARSPLRQAVELARVCGAKPLAERAHVELCATGARPRGLVFSGVASLTARERQVAELAVGGRSNPEIAQALFVTRKTVETHLGSAYRKLGVDVREQLAGALVGSSDRKVSPP